jgi:cytochrome P450
VFRSTTYDAGTVDRDAVRRQVTDMATTLIAELDRRRTEPQDDLLTAFVQVEKLDGTPFDTMELLGQVWFVISGGLDTTTSLAAWTLEYLARHADIRRQLVDDPDRIPAAIEEFLRLFPVNETLSRTVTDDVVLGDQQLRRGDHVLISWLSANRDEHVFDDPETCRLDRAVNPHLAFGAGGHRCIGMHVAKQIFEVVLRDMLRRLPDFTVAELREPPCMPLMRSVTSLVLAFPPGEREHPPSPSP